MGGGFHEKWVKKRVARGWGVLQEKREKGEILWVSFSVRP